MTQCSVLIVEDDPLVRRTLRFIVESAGHRVAEAAGCAAALKALREASPDVVLADHALGDGTALDLLREVEGIDPRVPVVVITGEGSIGLAVDAMKRGAHHFITKPAQAGEILRAIDEAVAERRDGADGVELNPLVGVSAALRRALVEAEHVLGTEIPVLIGGETGTGKTLLARWLHQNSPRAAKPFVAVNCAGLSPEGADFELFGWERGAVPGAATRRTGLVEAATGGTLFLDEIGDLAPAVQAKLLQVLDERRFRRLGSVEELECDLRLVAATQHDLDRRVREGAFRRDLYFRICRASLVLPPLRSRTEDLPALVGEILARFGPARARGVTLAPDALDRLRGHSWPGNLRELRNVVERAALRGGPELHAQDIRFDEVDARTSPGSAATLAEIERAEIERVLGSVNFNVAEAATRLEIPRSTLYQRLKEYGIALPRR